MKLQIAETGIIKKQTIEIAEDVSLIYGYNNSGKTSILRVINNALCEVSKKKFILGERIEPPVYIPTNRVIVSERNTEIRAINDLEDFINYQNDFTKEYSLYLKNLRDLLLSNPIIYDLIYETIKEIFEVEIEKNQERLSDGIENIINIYIVIIWSMIWDTDIAILTKENLKSMMHEKKLIILIDEIEMFLHVCIQSKLVNKLKQDFRNCAFVFTTHSPLFLTRHKGTSIYNIEAGTLKPVEIDMYYKDLDMVYETFFNVEELPGKIREYINYLVRVIINEEKADVEKMNMIEEEMQRGYSNLFEKYKKIIYKAKARGELYDKNQED